MSSQSLNLARLQDYLRSAQGIHEMFNRLGYSTYEVEPQDKDDLELDEADVAYVKQVYLLNDSSFGHSIWLYEVEDTSQIRLRGLAYNALERGGTHLLVVTKDYSELIFVHPEFVGGASKSHVRVSKLKVVTGHPTRHDLDTLEALHAHRRSAAEVYKAQKEAFDVSRVTNKFYREYREYFNRVLAAVVANNLGIPEFQNSDQKQKLHAFVQRLMGRMMFLYFLQRKGWLGEEADFLSRRYKEVQSKYAGNLTEDSSYFYREVLDPLFFETLNKQRPENWTQWNSLKIPYLNGGLFDRARDPQGIITLPDSLFDSNSDSGLLAFFNRYNFTIADDTPLEQDVAVDPEMLGKVFENMLEEQERGQSGSFYTPRSIVSYMCQEALAGYLEESAGIPREESRQHFDPDALINFSDKQAEAMTKALDSLTVLDPAVGSGSFLVGMMQEILQLRKKAAAALKQHATPSLRAQWKEAIIRDNLYGVDIKPEAIEIAQLRLWLALIVDQKLEDARPLPNLDYKLMAGDSLIETIDGEPVLGEAARQLLQAEVKPAQPSLFNMDSAGVAEASAKLEDLRREFFAASPDRRKQLSQDIKHQERTIIEKSLQEKLDHLATRIDSLEKAQKAAGGQWSAAKAREYSALLLKREKLENYQKEVWKEESSLPFFLYRLHFNDVFAKKGGFDIVVANPPYVRHELITDQKAELEPTYPEVYAGTADLYVYFFARGFNLLKNGGELVFITPNKFMRASYGKKLRDFLANKVYLNILIDFGDLPIFDATTYPMITLASKNLPDDTAHLVKILIVKDMNIVETLNETMESATTLRQSSLRTDGWQLSDSLTLELIEKLRTSGSELKRYVNNQIFYGIKTGLNEAFVINQETYNQLTSDRPKNKEVLKPWLRGRDIKRWQANWDGYYLIAVDRTRNLDDYPEIKEHLLKFKAQLERRAGNQAWHEHQSFAANFEKLEQAKIIYPDIAPNVRFSLDTNHIFLGNTAYFIPTTDLYLLGVLNSSVIEFCYSHLSPQIRGGYYRFFTQYVEQLPIVSPTFEQRIQIESLVTQLLEAGRKPAEIKQLENEINSIVYEIYDVVDSIGIIERDLQIKSNQETADFFDTLSDITGDA